MCNRVRFCVNIPRPQARVSVILLDWGVRESFHSLYYLNRQTVPRSEYDLVWIEFYDRRPKHLAKAVEKWGADGPALDKWIVLGYDVGTYFHKHRMYNVGIAVADGEICVLCDSDAMFSPTFIENVVRGFEENPGSFLHLDEVRNNSRRFYPFNFPSFEEVLERDCINWTGATTIGLNNSPDMLHEANYGACFAARREDLIRIGGADEHVDYLGYICGPYELSFRLINAGLSEVWLRDEYLYHTWHPGESGINLDYHGPSDGRGMAQRALDAREHGQVLPYHENPAMRELRLSGASSRAVPTSSRAVPARTGATRPGSVISLEALLDAETEAFWKRVADEFHRKRRVSLVELGFRGFDLYSYGGAFYAIPSWETTFDPERAKNGGYEQLYSAGTLLALKVTIRRRRWKNRLRRFVRRWIPRESWVNPWIARMRRLRRRLRFPKRRLLFSSSRPEPRRPGSPSSPKPKPAPQPPFSPVPRLVRESFCGFNIIHYRTEWYAQPQGNGEFNARAALWESASECLRAASETEILALVRRERPPIWRLKHFAHRRLPGPLIRTARALLRSDGNAG